MCLVLRLAAPSAHLNHRRFTVKCASFFDWLPKVHLNHRQFGNYLMEVNASRQLHVPSLDAKYLLQSQPHHDTCMTSEGQTRVPKRGSRHDPRALSSRQRPEHRRTRQGGTLLPSSWKVTTNHTFSGSSRRQPLQQCGICYVSGVTCTREANGTLCSLESKKTCECGKDCGIGRPAGGRVSGLGQGWGYRTPYSSFHVHMRKLAFFA